MNIKLLIKKLENNYNELNNLDVRFLCGYINSYDYHNQREKLRQDAKKLVLKYNLDKYADCKNILEVLK